MRAKITKCELNLQNASYNYKTQAKITKRELKSENANTMTQANTITCAKTITRANTKTLAKTITRANTLTRAYTITQNKGSFQIEFLEKFGILSQPGRPPPLVKSWDAQN